MILITYNLDSISVTQSYLNDIIKSSVIQHITVSNELQNDIIYQFTDILNTINYGYDDIANDWRIFKLLVGNLKTIYNENKIINDYIDSISLLCANIPAVKIAKYFKTHLCNLNNIPKIIKAMQLTDLYEQLVFYEYIYMSDKVSYSYKLICIIENQYELLLSLLSKCYIDICSNGVQETKDNMLLVYKTYFKYDTKISMFRKYEECHEKYLDYYDTITDNATHIYNCVINDNLIDIKMPIKLIDMCYLNNIYNTENQHKISTFIKAYRKHIILDSFDIKSTMDNVVLYEILDMIVKMMEIDDSSLEIFSDKQLSKVLSKWMHMCDPSYYFHAEQLTYPYNYNDNKTRLRDIILSKTITNILNSNNYTFNEIGYILTMDRLDMFMIITRNLKFKTIHPDIFKYMSPKIIEYVINKCLENTHTEQIDFGDNRIIINPYNFADRDVNEIKNVATMINNYIYNYKLDYISIMNTYNFVECIYISLYWEYNDLINNNIGRNILTFISNIDEPYDKFTNNSLEFTMLKIVIDDIYDSPTIIDNYFNRALKDNTFIINGTDIIEIEQELLQYNITNNNFINIMKECYEKLI